MIQIKVFTFNPFAENTYVLWDETMEAAVVDPGCYERSEQKQLTDFIESNQLKVTSLLNTHCHLDHIFGNEFIKDYYKVPLWIHPDEMEVLQAAPLLAEQFGVPFHGGGTPDHFYQQGESVRIGATDMEWLFVPGHSPGHIALIHKDQKICIGGDVVFQGSIGRTDLPGGNHSQLINSIRTQILPLDPETVIYPGHGPSTTVGAEKRINPFLQ